jgi:hypothetical protein
MLIQFKRYSRRELMIELQIGSYSTFKREIKGIEADLGRMVARRYSPLQVEKICKHLAEPIIYPPGWENIKVS